MKSRHLSGHASGGYAALNNRLAELLTDLRGKYRAIFEVAGTSAALIEEDMTISLVSPAFEQISGYTRDEIEGRKKWTEFVSYEEIETMKNYHNIRRIDPEIAPKSYKFKFIDRHGVSRECIVNVSMIPGTKSSVASILNIADMRRSEDPSCDEQKIESIVEIADSIADIFNNILTTIIGCGKILQTKIDRNDYASKYVEQILLAAGRAATLTQNLLAFSRKQTIYPTPEDANKIVRRVQSLLADMLGDNIKLIINTASDNLTVLAESGQIENVLLRLASNARDAMPEGGVLTINTGSVRLPAQRRKGKEAAKQETYALISVEDTGKGMDEKTKRRIFEPFFTTKDADKYSGLGLSIVCDIIRQLDGIIDVSSTPGKGAAFKIYLPLANN